MRLGIRKRFLLWDRSDAGNSPVWVLDHVRLMEVSCNDEAETRVFDDIASSTNGPLTPASRQTEATGLSEARLGVTTTRRWRQRCDIGGRLSSILAMGESGLGVARRGYL
jgi:hypothetical protein